ncbi:MAG: sulfotransferase [Planctomycetes bacterium]|nr:sulfotransferase [Planctomycetota bacterium]
MTKLAFIMAASHSGSTLLTMLLGSHPQATTIGDTAGTIYRKDPDYRCSCGRKAKECSFWLHIIGQMTRLGFNLDATDFGTRFEYPESRFINRVLHTEHRGPILETIRDGLLRLNSGWCRQFRTIAARNVALFETVTRVTDSQILVDSSKLPHRLKFLLRIPEIEVKVIHLVRDGRGVVHTYIQNNGWPVEKSAIEWQRGILAAEKLLARLNQSMWRQLRYEDLCSNPKGELEKLCVFLDLDPSQVTIDFRSAGLHIFGNKMRLSSEQAIHLDSKWQTELTDSQISTIEHLAGKQLKKYGYMQT